MMMHTVNYYHDHTVEMIGAYYTFKQAFKALVAFALANGIDYGDVSTLYIEWVKA